MAVVLYARKSVERENSISCDTQITYCRSALRPDEQQEEVFVFVDNGFSGGNVNRDGFQKMMQLVRQDKVSKVIVYKLDRISRSLSDFVNILQEFKAHKVEFVSSQESFDTSSPYGEMIVKILMVFAEFERTSIINRVTQAYAHRSEMGFYMGGRQPYGFELAPAVIQGIQTKKLSPVLPEAEQIRYIFEVYARENVSLRRLQKLLNDENKKPLNGSVWSAAKISVLLKNPIYVRADADVYDYFDRRGVRIITDPALFTGKCGAQLYGRTKHHAEDPDWSDMKLVLLTHEGIVDSGIWLKCQRKLEKNRQIGNSTSNRTSWLSGRVACEKCGYAMTTIKGKIGRNGEIRRYFNCTGKSHKKICTGTKVTVYAQDLENMVSDCIFEKLSDIKEWKPDAVKTDTAQVNAWKLKMKEIERTEKQLMDAVLSGGFQEDLLALANRKAAQLKRERTVFQQRIQELENRRDETDCAVNLAGLWKKAGYDCRKEASGLLIHKIMISENGDAKIIWNI